MKYVFDSEKAIRNGAYKSWARECDGKEVRDGIIVGTQYSCPMILREDWCRKEF